MKRALSVPLPPCPPPPHPARSRLAPLAAPIPRNSRRLNLRKPPKPLSVFTREQSFLRNAIHFDARERERTTPYWPPPRLNVPLSLHRSDLPTPRQSAVAASVVLPY